MYNEYVKKINDALSKAAKEEQKRERKIQIETLENDIKKVRKR